MRKAVLVLLALTQSAGCAAYKVTATSHFEAKAPIIREQLKGKSPDELTLVKLNEYPEGAHCFEPLLYVLTLGLVPTHCLLRFHVSESPAAQTDSLETDFEVTAMQGWIALFLPLSPHWQFGYDYNVDDAIRCQISAEC